MQHLKRPKVWKGEGAGLRFHLAILVVATAVPLLVLSLYLFNRTVDTERRSIRFAMTNSAQTLAALVDNEIDAHAAIAQTLSGSPALQIDDYAAFWQEAKAALEFIPGAWLELCDPSGKYVLTTLQEFGTPLPKRVDVDVQAKAFATGRLQVSDIGLDPISGRMSAFVEVPFFRDGQPAYSLLVSLAPARFLHLIQNKFGREEVIGILDRHSRFLARIPNHEARVGTLASDGWRAALARSTVGSVENYTLEGDLALTAFATTAHGWVAGISYRVATLDAPLNRILWSVSLMAAGLTALSLGLAYLRARSFSESIRTLAKLARDVGAGKVVDPPEPAFREAALIGKALSDASILLEQRAKELARFNAELEDKVVARTGELVLEMHRREESESKFRQAQKMEAIGQLTGGIAHDFNNMLGVVKGSLELMRSRIERGDFAVGRFMEAATKATERAAALTYRLLAFARQQPLAPEPIDVNKMIDNMSDLLRSTLGEQIRIEMVAAAGLWRTNADAHQLESVILNVAINARDAMQDGGKLTIETANAYLDEAYCRQYEEVTPGQYVQVAISDTGIGMPPPVAARAFDPFFTTKPAGKGTGLGLSQVYGFIKQSHGHVKIYSEIGAGTTVKIYLPRQIGETEPTVHALPQAAPTSAAGELVLVVEDDPLMRQTTADALRDLGYSVMDSETAGAALGLLDQISAINLLLTDVVMPEVNGKKLADEALSRRPDLKVLFMTGYTPNAIVRAGVLDPGLNLLTKPFTIDQLAAKVRAVLDA